MENRWKSWALWVALAALLCFVVLNVAGVDISEPLNAVMALLLPVLVAFGVINDPAVRHKLGLDTGLQWYQSWTVWLALAALITYCVRLFINLDVGPVVTGFMNVLLPLMIAMGIVKSPSADS